jgi:hypothetical protein
MRLESLLGASRRLSIRWEPPPRSRQIRRSSIMPITTVFFSHMLNRLPKSRPSRRNSTATRILKTAASGRFPGVFNHRHLLPCNQSLTQLADPRSTPRPEPDSQNTEQPSPISGHFAPPLWRMFPARTWCINLLLAAPLPKNMEREPILTGDCSTGALFLALSIKLSRKLWNPRIPQRGVHYCL